MTEWWLSEVFLRTFWELSTGFLWTFWGLSEDFLRTFWGLSKDFFRKFFKSLSGFFLYLSENFLRPFWGLSASFWFPWLFGWSLGWSVGYNAGLTPGLFWSSGIHTTNIPQTHRFLHSMNSYEETKVFFWKPLLKEHSDHKRITYFGKAPDIKYCLGYPWQVPHPRSDPLTTPFLGIWKCIISFKKDRLLNLYEVTKHWSFKKKLYGALWYIGTLVYWYIGPLVYWYIQNLVHKKKSNFFQRWFKNYK